MLFTHFSEVVIKIEVKDNNVEQTGGLKRKLQRDGFFKLLNLRILTKNLPKKKEF